MIELCVITGLALLACFGLMLVCAIYLIGMIGFAAIFIILHSIRRRDLPRALHRAETRATEWLTSTPRSFLSALATCFSSFAWVLSGNTGCQ